jgi:serine/threonine protein kinase
MEWIEDELSSTNLDARDVPILLTHISEGLVFMHANGFTHRDLKPENILIQLSRQRLTAAKIADFGTTKYDLSGKMQTYTGSSVYMAPEFWEQELAYTNAVDMWSFGVIAVQCLTGWEPSSEAWDPRFPPTRAQHQKWIREVLRPREAVAPERFRPLLRGLLSETPGHRWTAVDSENWLQKNAKAEIGAQGDTGSIRKRDASPGEDTLRRIRSNPTARADNESLPGIAIPDTEPCGSPTES